MASRFLIGLLAVSLLVGCTLQAADPARHEAGRALYNFRCYYCHGYSGDARTAASTFLRPPPRDFRRETPQTLPRASILSALREGRPGTAMKSYAGILSTEEMDLLADFVTEEFLVRKALNTRYHTAENGWPAHERYRDAFPFATGELALDAAPESLTAEQAAGKRLFLSACITCHVADSRRRERATARRPSPG